ncbi:MAG: hypothetical protein IJL76_03840 [Bacilli bacterium]|nr:hypothetical protein [Bacilli bacterium]
MDDYIKEVSDNLDLTDKFVNINDFLLKKEEIEVLDKYDIDYKSCNSLKDVIYLIDEIFQNSYDEMTDLEEVAISIGDRDYYVNSNK